jgi:hypothetical protein
VVTVRLRGVQVIVLQRRDEVGVRVRSPVDERTLVSMSSGLQTSTPPRDMNQDSAANCKMTMRA